MPEYRERNSLEAHEALPEWYWTGNTQMACMKEALTTTLRLGWVHHIMRLMVLGNFGLLLGIKPKTLNDWFWAMYIDAYDWVMVPNVIGMTLHADEGIVGTKPYAASARYIDTMSNACKSCRYSPRSATEEDSCPFNALYWDFLARHRARFERNPRMALMMRSLAGRPAAWLTAVRARAQYIRESIHEV
jgi:deoxyribodipyrimidine photolyase-related protein